MAKSRYELGCCHRHSTLSLYQFITILSISQEKPAPVGAVRASCARVLSTDGREIGANPLFGLQRQGLGRDIERQLSPSAVTVALCEDLASCRASSCAQQGKLARADAVNRLTRQANDHLPADFPWLAAYLDQRYVTQANTTFYN